MADPCELTPARVILDAAGEKAMRFGTRLWLALVLGLAACSSKESTGTVPVVSPPAAGVSATPTPTAGTGASGTAAVTAGAPADTGDVPCAVASVLKQHCVRCHGNTLREGAPVSLVDSASFRKDSN